MTALLEAAGVSAAYGHVQSLFGVDLTIEEGEVVALMGRNGMGKTTTIRCICRMLPLAGGRISFCGRDLGALPAHRAAQLGIGLVPEGRRCFATLSVAENLRVAARPEPASGPDVLALFPALSERLDQSAATLSGGEQQMLAIGRALMTNPRLLILDEATEGLAPVVRAQIWHAVEALKGAGLAILVVDKSLREMKAVMDRAVILERGESVWEGPPGALSDHLAARYLGV